MTKILTYFSFVIASLVVMATFMTATTYSQLGVAIVLYPLLIYFAYKILLRNTQSSPNKHRSQTQVAKSVEKTEGAKIENVGIADIDKRVFLKLLGGAGLSLFLFSIFNRKIGGVFPGATPLGSGATLLKDTTGNQIDPAENQPTDGYIISEIDDINVISFYGFINQNASWYIMRQDSGTGAFRYVKGTSNFPESWTNRENLSYDYFSNVFRA